MRLHSTWATWRACMGHEALFIMVTMQDYSYKTMNISVEQLALLLRYKSKMNCKLLFKREEPRSICPDAMSFLVSRRSSDDPKWGSRRQRHCFWNAQASYWRKFSACRSWNHRHSCSFSCSFFLRQDWPLYAFRWKDVSRKVEKATQHPGTHREDKLLRTTKYVSYLYVR